MDGTGRGGAKYCRRGNTRQTRGLRAVAVEEERNWEYGHRWTDVTIVHRRLHALVPTVMGKSQSKLSSEQLADLQKHTYCMYSPTHRIHRTPIAHSLVTVDKKELQQWSVHFPHSPSEASTRQSGPGTRAF
jgi:hypothetical protein